jgi:hypothetical protein
MWHIFILYYFNHLHLYIINTHFHSLGISVKKPFKVRIITNTIKKVTLETGELWLLLLQQRIERFTTGKYSK